jgi:hypothetical protein
MRSSVAPQRSLLKDLRNAVLANNFREAQRLRSSFVNVKRVVEGRLRDNLEDLFEISCQWVQNVGNRHDNKRLIQQSIRRTLAAIMIPSRGDWT